MTSPNSSHYEEKESKGTQELMNVGDDTHVQINDQMKRFKD